MVQIYTDVVPDELYDPSLRARFDADGTRQGEDAATNQGFQQNAFQTLQLPLYAIVEQGPDGEVHVVATYEEGRIANETAFADFLRDPK